VNVMRAHCRALAALLGTALLAYTFGLRHAVDADHIAAIDNVVRKLMQVGQRPLSVGFFFALGHSTVVLLATVAIAATAAALQGRLEAFREGGGVIGTAVSALFLLSIAPRQPLIPPMAFSWWEPMDGRSPIRSASSGTI
jgi:HoxN/HupN/NixA family high-affinity nickel-transporter